MNEPAQRPRKKLKKVAGPDSGGDADDGDKASGGGNGKTLIIAVAVAALMLGVGVGVGFFVGGAMAPPSEQVAADGEASEDGAESEEVEPQEDRHRIYVSVGKLLATVEHEGSTRYIQAEMDLVGYDKAVMDEAVHDMPAIRNRLLLLFSSQAFEEVKTVEGREALRMASIAAVNDVLGKKPKLGVADAYFTAFVTQ